MSFFKRKVKKQKGSVCVLKREEKSVEEYTQVLALATLLVVGCKEEVILYSGLYCLTHYNDSKTQAATLCN